MTLTLIIVAIIAVICIPVAMGLMAICAFASFNRREWDE